MRRRSFLASLAAIFAPVAAAPALVYRRIAGRIIGEPLGLGPEDRYLFRLASVPVSADTRLRVSGWRQTDVRLTGPGSIMLYASVKQSPHWTFGDGDVAWHLKSR